MRHLTVLVRGLLVVGVLLVPCHAAADELATILARMADRQYDAAGQACERFLAATPRGPRARLVGLLQVRAALEAGQLDRALTLARTLGDAGGREAFAARFLEAEALLARGKTAEAVAIYRAALPRLAGDAAMRRMAKAYRALGRQHADSPERAGDAKRAARYFALAHDAEPNADRAREDLAQVALQHQQAGNPAAAITHWTRLLGDRGAPPALRQMALYHRGLAQLGMRPQWIHKMRRRYQGARSFDGARRDFQALLDADKDSKYAARALYQLGKSFRPTESRSTGRDRGITRWTTLIERFPRSPEAAHASYELGLAYQAAGDAERAIATWDRHRTRYPADANGGAAAFAAGRAAHELRRPAEAIRRLTAYLKAYPTGTHWQSARQLIEDASFRAVLLAHGAKQPAAAERALTDYLTRYPAGRHAQAGHLLRGEMALEAGRPEAAEAAWRTLTARFPTSVMARRARLRLASLAEAAGQLEQAVAELQALIRLAARSPEGRKARAQLAAFEQSALEVVVPRPFAAGETARLALVLRNLPKVEILAYKFDLQAYFEKHHAVGDIGGLATEIVDPDHRQTYEVPDYTRFRKTTIELPLPALKGAGAWIVEVRSEARRAKALLLKSELGLVARIAGTEALAFVTGPGGAPRPGARILIAGPDGVIARITSGKDGVARAGWKTGTQQLQLLAIHDGHYAVASGRARRGRETTLAARGYVYTDRPLYRPGDTLQYRAILRDARRDSYRVPQGKATVEILDSRGLPVARAEHTLDRFGTLAGTLALPAEPSLGRYTINVSRGGQTFSGSCWVEVYRTPPFEVAVAANPSVSAPGQTARIRVAARYRFGTAVAGGKVELFLARRAFTFDDTRYRAHAWFTGAARRGRETVAQAAVVLRRQATTDAQGRATIELRLPEADRAYRYLAHVRVTDAAGQRVVGQGSLYAVLAGYHAVLLPERKVVRPAEPAQVRLVTVRPDHQPRSAEGQLLIWRHDGDTGWQRVGRQAARTDDGGRAMLRLTLEQPGRHRLEFVGTDDGGHPVRATARIDVAGPTQAQELTLRAERAVYHQGQQARIHLSTPADGLHVLLTYEAEGVLDHRVIRVAGRATTIDLPLPARYAPNGQLTASVLHGNRLYSASDALIVLEYLAVEVTPVRDEARPGESVKVRLRTLDQTGQPVAAAVSLAVVDSAIGQLKADPAGPIKPHFYYYRRRVGVRGAGSAFRYTARDLPPLTALASEREAGAKDKHLDRAGAIMEPGDADDAPMSDAKPDVEESKSESRSDLMRRFGGRAAPRDSVRRLRAAVESLDQALDAQQQLQKAARQQDFSGPQIQLGAYPYAAFFTQRSFFDQHERLSELLAGLTHRRAFRDTAGWWPSIVTGADGTAEVTLALPDNLTRWTLHARGASTLSQFGEGRARLTTTQPLLLQVRTPRFLVEGDRARGTLEVHNNTGQPLELATGSRLGAASKTLLRPDRQGRVGPRQIERSPITLAARRPGTQILEAVGVAANGPRDAVQRPLPVLPAGVRILRTGAGRLASAASRQLSLPPRTDRRSARLVIGVDPDPDRSLERALDMLRQFPYGCFEQTVSRFLPAVSAIHAYRALGKPNDRLESRFLPLARAGLGRVYAMQRTDGGWGWWAGQGASPVMTGYGLLALELCRTSGLVAVLPARLAKARAAARGLYAKASDDERALILFGLAHGGPVDAARLGALVRRREALEPAALALTALAAHRLERPSIARTLLARLISIGRADGDGLSWKGSGGFLGGALESTGLALLALARVDKDRARCQAATDYLMRQRQGVGWGTTKASALVLLGLAEARGLMASPATDYRLTLTVNGHEIGRTVVRAGKPGAERMVWTVGADQLKSTNEVVIDKQGEGVLYFWYRLEAFRRGKVAPDGNAMSIERRFRRGADPLDGRPTVRPGHACWRPDKRPLRRVRPVTKTAVGELIRVELTLTLDRDADYVIVEDPLPAGFVPEDGGRTGSPDRSESRLDRMAFFFTHLRRGAHTLSYQIRALYAGDYRVNPARAEQMYRPAVYAHGASATLQVSARPADAGTRAQTPDELLAAAIAAHEAGRPEAEAMFTALLGQPLRPAVVADIARRLLALRGKRGGAPLVEAYELLREADPKARLPFEPLSRVADAYADLDRPTRALELYRILFDRRLSALRTLADVRHESGDGKAGQAEELRLLRRFPPTPVLVATYHRWAMRFAGMTDASKAGIKLLRPAIEGLTLHAALWPRSPLARHSRLQLIALSEQAGDHARAVVEARRYLASYPDATRRDSVLLALARNAFADGDHGQADRAAAALSKALIRQGKTTRPSPHRPYAIYLRAQIAHAKGDLAAAVRLYAQVARRYPDAADTVRFVRRKALWLPPVMRVAPGGAVALPIRYRNVSDLQVALYRVDLLTLFLMRGGRETVRNIELSGITPHRSLTRTLPAAEGLGLRRARLDLGRLAAGAYLAVARTDDREEASFVLVSDLELRVQRHANRIQVHALKDGKPAAGVQVRIAVGGKILARGLTDARGLFSHADRSGHAAVVAFTGDVYALWSGEEAE